MIQTAHPPQAEGVRRAIDDAEIGPKLRACRIYTPAEVERSVVVSKIRRMVSELGRVDLALAEELEKALTDREAFTRLSERYFDVEERLRMGTWPEMDQFRTLEEGVLLRDFVVRAYRPDLQGWKIAILFQEKLPPAARRERLGTAFKLPGKMHHVSGLHGIITISFQRWRRLTDTDRQRLMHHELEHLQVADGALTSRGHDFEDFASIVELYGIRSESGEMNMDDDVAEALYAAAAGQFELSLAEA